MKTVLKLVLLGASLFSISSAFAFDRINIMAYGGYDKVDSFKDDSSSSSIDGFTGYDAGINALISLSGVIISPIFGAGVHMNEVSKKDIESSSGTYNLVLKTQSATGHFGLKFAGPLFRFFMYGNGGYGLSGSLDDTAYNTSGTQTGTTSYKLKDHTFYGGTLALAVAVAPFIKMGVNAIYNTHSAKYDDTVSGVTSTNKLTYNEVSGNFVIDINL
jgi:hypothetical protein